MHLGISSISCGRKQNMSIFKLIPECKDYIWGGNRLIEEYGINAKGDICAEAWVLSGHKDGSSTISTGIYKGMTLDKLVVDCSRIFEKGQAYVAMSRVKTLDGLFLKNFSKDKVMVDQRVAEFYSNLKEADGITTMAQLEFNL